MEIRLAVIDDLPQIISVYKEIIKNMNENQIEIWDDIYPCDFFREDIEKNCLYILLDDKVVVSAFVLCDKNTGAESVNWERDTDNVLYLDRFGVNVNYTGKGIGSLMLDQAKKTAKRLGAEYLRLFVVDVNRPAILLYQKNGFARAAGVYEEVIDVDFVLREYGYEITL